MKASFDLDSIKEFCIRHAEKFVFGVVVLGLVFLAYGATTVSTVEFTPEDLSQVAKDSKEHVEGTSPTEYLAAEAIEATSYPDKVQAIPVDVGGYAWETAFLPHMWQERPKRREPEVYVVEDLRATAGHAKFNIPSPAMVRGTRREVPNQGRRWVVLTGLLPIVKQIEAYEDAFRDAYRDPRRDMPLYCYYEIERAELSSSGEAAQLKWRPINPWQRLVEAFRTWRPVNEVVHSVFLPARYHPYFPMYFPLGPNASQPWGEDVAHYPEILLAADVLQRQVVAPYAGPLRGMMPGFGYEEGEEMDQYEEEESSYEEEEEEGGMPFGPRLPFPAAGMPGMPSAMPEMPFGPPGAPVSPPTVGTTYPGTGAPYPGTSAPYPGTSAPYSGAPYSGAPSAPAVPYGPGMTTPYSGAPYGGATPYGPQAPSPYGPQMGMQGVAGTRTPLEVKHQLFRFFDFHVVPGKRYQYRVRIYLRNPNYKLPSRYLEREELAAEPFSMTKWSDESNVVSVPRDSRLLAGSVRGDRLTSVLAGSPLSAGSVDPRFIDGQTADVLAVTFREKDGLETANKFTVLRGQLASKLEGTIARGARGGVPGMIGSYYRGSSQGEEMEAMEDEMYQPYPYRGPERERTEEEKIEHDTGMVLLDIAGGNRLYRSGDEELTEPGTLLILDPDGNLLVCNELDDLDEVASYPVPEEEKRPRPRREKRMPPGYEEGYEEMMGDYYEMGDEEEEYARPRGRRSRRGPPRSSRPPREYTPPGRNYSGPP